MTQLEMFAIPPQARHTDPPTSHAAARRMQATGAARGHKEVILKILRDHPGIGAKRMAELSETEKYGMPLANVQIDRRMGELAKEGKVYRKYLPGSWTHLQMTEQGDCAWWPHCL